MVDIDDIAIVNGVYKPTKELGDTILQDFDSWAEEPKDLEDLDFHLSDAQVPGYQLQG